MFLTMMIALELETFPSFRSLKRHTDSLDPYVLRMLVLSSCMYLSIHACAVKHPSAKAAARSQLGIMLVLIRHAGQSLLLSLFLFRSLLLAPCVRTCPLVHASFVHFVPFLARCRETELEKVQWLVDGMSVEEVAALFEQREQARADGDVQVQGSDTRMRSELEAAQAENRRLDAAAESAAKL
jgi:hypothetical protein